MKTIFALVVAMLVILAPAMAFVPTIPSDIEKVGLGLSNGQITYDSASYTYARAVADAGATNFVPQAAYSGVTFGATMNGQPYGIYSPETSGVVANAITTGATGADGLTRQLIQQSGTASVTTIPASYYDAENVVDTPVVKASISNTNLAWVSGDLTSFSATPSSFGVVGGNYIDPAADHGTYGTATFVPGVSNCGNVWLYENDPLAPTIAITGSGANLLDAYAGSQSSTSLTGYPAVPGTTDFFVPSHVTMSGYSENFAGYDGASVLNNAGSGASLLGNGITMDIGASKVIDSWNSHYGVSPLDYPINADFSTTGTWGGITWPQIGTAVANP